MWNNNIFFTELSFWKTWLHLMIWLPFEKRSTIFYMIECLTNYECPIMFSQEWMIRVHHFQENKEQYLLQWQNSPSRQKLEFWKTCICPGEFNSFPVFRVISNKTGDNNCCDLKKKLHREMCQPLEALHNSANHCLPNDQWMVLWNHRGKRSVKPQDRSTKRSIKCSRIWKVHW